MASRDCAQLQQVQQKELQVLVSYTILPLQQQYTHYTTAILGGSGDLARGPRLA